ncbi:MAG: hypothetical protein ABIJ00_04195 [Candidatus Eisenbacteria bacterium]
MTIRTLPGICISAGLILILIPQALFGQLYRLETENLNLIYAGKALEYMTPHVVNCYERSLAYHRAFFDYDSHEKVTILLQDFWDYGTGGTGAVPRNRMALNIAPFSYVYETRPANERMNWLMNHEMVHVVCSDKASGTDNFFRSIFFGKVSATAQDPISMLYSYLTVPRWYCPRWYHEGIAVFMETWMAGGLGRSLGAYDEMVFRTKIRDGNYIYNAVGLESEGTASDFQVGANSYLYGTRFYSYLALEHGPENLIKWVTRTDDSKRYFSSQFKKVYGVSLSDEWSRWVKWEHQWQEANLERIRSYPTTAFRPLSPHALGSVSRGYYNPKDRKIYAALLYPGETAHIAALDIDTGRLKKVCDVRGAALYYVTSLAYDPESGTLFFTTDNAGWRDLVAVDVETGETRLLIKDVRTGDLTFNRSDKSIWGVRHYNGLSTIVRIPYPYEEWNHVYSFTYGKDIFDIDISPDGRYVTGALTDVSGLHLELIRMDTDLLLSGGGSYDVLFDFENSTPANFVFSPDGNFLYGSSYYSGVSNIYRYDLREMDMDLVSNCETGFFRPLPVSDDSLVVFQYTGQGFVPGMISSEPIERAAAIRYLGQEVVDNHPVVTTWSLTGEGPGDVDSLITDSGDYHLPPEGELVSAYPVVEGYKDYAAVGMRFNFEDMLGISNTHLTGTYTPVDELPEEERLHVGFAYSYWNWNVNYAYNNADFYDLFGPTKTSLKGHCASVGYHRTLLWEEPRKLDLSIGVSGYAGLERLPDYQNVAASYDKSMSYVAALGYEDVAATLGAVDYEKGVKAQLEANDVYVNSEHFPRVYATLDYGFLLPADHWALWLRSSAGHSFGDGESPFGNFYFGGFGNNWVDRREIKRYRDYYSFPGAELNAVGGKNYGKLMMELLLPPVRFKRLGLTSAYFRWARLALFSSGIMTNPDCDVCRRELINVGGQIDFRLVTFSLLNSTLSFGYAAAMERDRKLSDEFMVSLKIL